MHTHISGYGFLSSNGGGLEWFVGSKVRVVMMDHRENKDGFEIYLSYNYTTVLPECHVCLFIPHSFITTD